MGKEWITNEIIPKDSFKIKEIRILKDILYSEKLIPTEGVLISIIKQEIKKEMDKREEPLLPFADIIHLYPVINKILIFTIFI